jgi:hypothetical protein
MSPDLIFIRTAKLTIYNAIGIVPPESIIGGVQLVPRVGLVHLEVLVVIVALILVGVYTHLVGIPLEGDGGIETDLAALLMIDGADLKAVLVATDETRLLASVPRGASAHDGRLGEDAGSAVGVWPVLGIDGGELLFISSSSSFGGEGVIRCVLHMRLNGWE